MRRYRWLSVAGSPALWIGAALGTMLTAVIWEVPYINWYPVVAPLEASPLVIRQDAKGDGRFLAPRSGRRRHRGVDLVAALHSPVRAIRSGTVVQIGVHRGLGRFVELEHRQHLHSVYAHLDEVLVEAGARVRQGTQIGTVGKTGNARHRWITPHLHLEVVKDGHPIDPQSLGLPIVDPARAPDLSGGAGCRPPWGVVCGAPGLPGGLHTTTRPLALVAGADTHEQGGE